LKKLDQINPKMAKPEKILPIGAILPFMLGGMCWVLASEVTPNVPFLQDPLSMFCVLSMIMGCFLVVAPKMFKWDWKSRYFGFGVICVGSTSLPGVISWLCIVFYSHLPLLVRYFLFLSYGAIVIWWCWRFVLYYQPVMLAAHLHSKIYSEDDDAVYYLQKNDTWLLNNRYRFRQLPPNIFFVTMSLLGFLSFPFARNVFSVTGIPVIHIFMAISFSPIVLLSLGLMTRGYLIYYHYPRKIKRKTGKEVYIDMATKTLP
jgi:hypothetical protein